MSGRSEFRDAGNITKSVSVTNKNKIIVGFLKRGVCAAVDGAVTRVSQPSTRARSRVSFAPATVIFVNWSTCTFSLTFLLNSFSY